MSAIQQWLSRQFDHAFSRIYAAPAAHTFLRDPDTFDGQVYSTEEFRERFAYAFGDPSRFYQGSGGIVPVQLAEIPGSFIQKGRTIERRKYRFASPCGSPWPEDREGLVALFRRTDHASDTLLLLAPGWGPADYGFEEGICSRLCSCGMDAAVMTVPLHQERTPKQSGNGQYWISPNLFLTIENFRRFTVEIRSLLATFRGRYRRVGLIGISSGGFQAALAANCDEVDFLFPVITGANLARITWQGSLTRRIREAFLARDISESQVGDAWSIIDQMTMGRHCKAQRIKQVISLADEVVPLDCQYAMFNAIGHRPAEKVELPCAHMSLFFWQNRVVQEIADTVGP